MRRGLRVLIVAGACGLLAESAVVAQAPPQAPRPAPEAVPGTGLTAYLEFAGLDAHAGSWRQTAAYKVLNETTAGAMFADLFQQLLAAFPQEPGPEARLPNRDDLMAIGRHVGRNGLAFGVIGPFDRKPDTSFGVLVLTNAARPGARALFDRVVRGRAPRGAETHEQLIDHRLVTLVRPDESLGSWAFWTEGQDLIVTFAQGADAVRTVLATLKGERPSAATHEVRTALAQNEGGFQSVGLMFLDVAGLPPLPPELGAMGLDGLRRIDYRFGFEGPALLTRIRLAAPTPRRGVLKLLDQPTFSAATLPPLPAGLRDFAVLALDGNLVLDALAALPDQAAPIAQFTDEFRRRTGLRLREDLLGVLGPRWAFYLGPEPSGVTIDPFGGFTNWLLHPPKLTAVAELRDREAFREALGPVLHLVNEQLRAAVDPGQPPPRIQPLKAGDGYVLDIPPELFPLPAGVRPTLLVGASFAALAMTPRAAQAALAARPDADDLKWLEPFGDRLVFLRQSDPRANLPELIANIPFLVNLLGRIGQSDPNAPPALRALGAVRIDPDLLPDPDAMRAHLFPSITAVSVDDGGLTLVSREAFPGPTALPAAPVTIALLLPAVQSAREAARRTQCVNNLKQLALALHNYHDLHGHFPAPAVTGKEGKPLLSWRVAILPFLEQQALYNEFHLDEPWDSPHNKALIERMPQVFACPSGSAPPGETPYQVLTGKGTAFESLTKTARVTDFLDGMSNTLLVVEAKTPIPWTKPEDVAFDIDPRAFQGNLDAGLKTLLGSAHPGGFNTAFADGSVLFLKDTIGEIVLRALATRAGGEVVSRDAF